MCSPGLNCERKWREVAAKTNAVTRAGRSVGHWSQLGTEEQHFVLCTPSAVGEAHGTTPCKHRAVTEQRHTEVRIIFRDIKLMAFFPESLEKTLFGAVPARKCTPPLKVCLPLNTLKCLFTCYTCGLDFRGQTYSKKRQSINQSQAGLLGQADYRTKLFNKCWNHRPRCPYSPKRKVGYGLSHAMASPLEEVVFKVSARPVIVLVGVTHSSPLSHWLLLNWLFKKILSVVF